MQRPLLKHRQLEDIANRKKIHTMNLSSADPGLGIWDVMGLSYNVEGMLFNGRLYMYCTA